MILVNPETLVEPSDRCPKCGERDADRLIWQDDEQVKCQTCGTVYRPDASPNADD